METIETENKKKSFFKRTFTIAKLNLFMLIMLIGFTLFSLFAPIVPAKYSRPLIQNSDNVIAGKIMNYTMQSCRYVGEGVVTTITRKLVSTSNPDLLPITLTSDTVTNPARCLDVKRSVLIPFSTPKGEYQLVITGVYQVIPLRKPITVQSTSDSFGVKEPTKEDVEMLERLQSNPDSVGGSSSTDPKQISNSGASSAQNSTSGSTPKSNQSTTNNTTTNNTTNNNTTNNNGSESEEEPGLIQRIINGLPLGL